MGEWHSKYSSGIPVHLKIGTWSIKRISIKSRGYMVLWSLFS